MGLQALIHHPSQIEDLPAAEVARTDLEIKLRRGYNGDVKLPGHRAFTAEVYVEPPGAEAVPLSKGPKCRVTRFFLCFGQTG
jgi:hypothetical protein